MEWKQRRDKQLARKRQQHQQEEQHTDEGLISPNAHGAHGSNNARGVTGGRGVLSYTGNVPSLDNDMMHLRRLSWMGVEKTESSTVVTIEDPDESADAARAARMKILNDTRQMLDRLGAASADGGATADRLEHGFVCYLDGTCGHSRNSVTAYNAHVRANMMQFLAEHPSPPGPTHPTLPAESEFIIPPIAEGKGILPRNNLSAKTWRELAGGEGARGYNFRADACARELLAAYPALRDVDWSAEFVSPSQGPTPVEGAGGDENSPAAQKKYQAEQDAAEAQAKAEAEEADAEAEAEAEAAARLAAEKKAREEDEQRLQAQREAEAKKQQEQQEAEAKSKALAAKKKKEEEDAARKKEEEEKKIKEKEKEKPKGCCG